MRVGNGLDPAVQLGPLISQKQLDRVLKYVDIGSEEGARLTHGGKRLGGDLAQGYFIEPTVFAGVHNDMTIAREEIFGPVISVIPFDERRRSLAPRERYASTGSPAACGPEVLSTAHIACPRASRPERSG